jgi:hypothetical protein
MLNFGWAFLIISRMSRGGKGFIFFALFTLFEYYVIIHLLGELNFARGFCMKKIVSLILVLITALLLCLTSCDSPKHEHISGKWEYNNEQHWRTGTCSKNKCDIEPLIENHIDDDKNNVCDICSYDGLTNSYDLAQILIDYESSLKNEINKSREENPEYNYYYHPVDEIHCTYILNRNSSADDIVAKYDMNNMFAPAKVSALNAIKMVSIIINRVDFTEAMHQKIKQISEEEALIENLFIDMQRAWVESYMPKIEYYTDNKTVLEYEATTDVINLLHDKCFIIKSKEEYDNYLNNLLERADSDYVKFYTDSQRDLYDNAFFKNNALIITKTITRSSGSIKLTVDNLYISENKVYVVIRTDIPGIGTDDMQYTSFTFKVSKKQVANVNEVITLE